MQKTLWNILKLLISAGLIAYILLTQVSLEELGGVLSGADWGWIAAAALVIVAGTALRALRWQALLQPLGLHTPLTRLVRLYFEGTFFSLFLPGGFGGDAYKMARLAQDTGRTAESIGVTLVERASGLWMLFVLTLVAMPFGAHLLPQNWLWPVVIICLVSIIGGWVTVTTPLLPWLAGHWRLPGKVSLERFTVAVARLGYPALGRAALVSLIFNLLLISFNWMIALSLGIDLPGVLYFLFTPVISFSLALPISLAGLGVREQTYVLLFSAAGIPAAQAVAMSLINYALSMVLVGLLGGALFALDQLRNLTSTPNPAE